MKAGSTGLAVADPLADLPEEVRPLDLANMGRLVAKATGDSASVGLNHRGAVNVRPFSIARV